MNYKSNSRSDHSEDSPSRVLVMIIVALILGCCQSTVTRFNEPPQWAKDVVWYQILPDRFYNGDPTNDPDINSLDGTWPYEKPLQWQISDWTSDWYALQSWERANGRDFYYNAQLRRYGGDLEGIFMKLDYLQQLGVTALYLNPVFESPSSHKYNCAMWHHVDNNFGPDPEGDRLMWEQENPADPKTWQWTAADRLLLKLIKEVHARGMKIILDGVFNHVGIPFWAFQHVRQHGPASPYADWFIIHRFDDPATEADEFDYQCWFGFTDLPEIREDDNGPPHSFREHIRAIVERWGDPNGDGNPEDGIDGWRLDVAERVHLNFWRDFRKWVRSVNPEAYLVGEVWWEDFPNNIMINAAPWLQGDVFDGVMNYRFADIMLKAFVDRRNRIPVSEMDCLLARIRDEYPAASHYVLQNLMGSHDVERLASMVANPDRWIDHASNLNYNPEFRVGKPSTAEIQIQKLILTFQFTYIGVPYIYYGDEVGMWGADDPDCRKPMVWQEFTYQPEVAHPFGLPKPVDSVRVDEDLLAFYRTLTRLRTNYRCLREGTYHTIMIDDQRGLMGFERAYDRQRIRVLTNATASVQPVQPAEFLDAPVANWRLILGAANYSDSILSHSALVFLNQQ